MAFGCAYFVVVCVGLLAVTNVHGERQAKSKEKNHSIEIVDNDPEFLVGVKGIDYPLCFHIDGSQNQVVRLLQDPLSGVIVNARIVHDELTNKTYLGAILVSQGGLRIIAKQRLVLLNENKVDWLPVTTHLHQGHRVVVGEDMVAVTFRKKNVTLIIRRHVATPTNDINYEDVDGRLPMAPPRDTVTSGDERTNVIDTRPDLQASGRNRADIMPVIGFEERDAIVNRVMSSKRRRGLILRNFFGINQDQTFVRNVVIEVDSQGRRKRTASERSDFLSRLDGRRQSTEKTGGVDSHAQLARHKRHKETVSEGRHRLHHSTSRNRHDKREVDNRRRAFSSFSSLDSSKTEDARRETRRRATSSRHQRDADDDYTLDENQYGEDAEKKRGQTIFLGLYIADSRDLSNRTHGLLGQFLFKNVSMEKIRYRNGKMIARLLVNGNPTRRTPAMLTLRRNMALNMTRACLKIRDQGREVIDGAYSDYLIPNIRKPSRPTPGQEVDDRRTVIVNFTDHAAESTEVAVTSQTTSIAPIMLYPTCVYETHHRTHTAVNGDSDRPYRTHAAVNSAGDADCGGGGGDIKELKLTFYMTCNC
ncbi:hypothetical protein Btru_048922 [Bulinus truncatus]|nr:hypothetical protein Btru_048922 [Bulinus truncatus]